VSPNDTVDNHQSKASERTINGTATIHVHGSNLSLHFTALSNWHMMLTLALARFITVTAHWQQCNSSPHSDSCPPTTLVYCQQPPNLLCAIAQTDM